MAKKTNTAKTTRHGPHLQVAALCERVITESDRVSTLVRLVDIFTIKSDKDDLPPGILQPTLVVAFKSGDAKGKFPLTVFARDPSGKKLAQLKAEIELLGGGQGPLIQVELPVPISTTGLHWMDVHLGSRLMTRVPFEIRHTKVDPSSAAPQPPAKATITATKKAAAPKVKRQRRTKS
jgi:hypothetical protein